ncbi:MAG: hypothetical protein ABSH10_01265 [Phycisphaerae bacterium]
MTRQVTGLAGFSGAIGYFPTDQIHLNLPTDAMDTFNRQSVGVSDVLHGNVYAPAPFYAPGRTIAGLPFLLSGQVGPGGVILSYPPPPMSAESLIQGGTVYTPFSVTPMNGAGGTGMYTAMIGGTFLQPSGTERTAIGGTGGLNLFALSNAAQQEQLARELSQVNLPADMAVRNEVNTRLEPSVARERRLAVPPEGEAEANEPNRMPSAVPAVLLPARGSLGRPPTPNQDVFRDMLYRMPRGPGGTLQPGGSLQTGGSMQLGGSLQPAPWLTPSATPQEETEEANAPSTVTEAIQARQPQLRQHPAALTESNAPFVPSENGRLVEYSPRTGIVLHGLAGTGPDQFNTTMALAQKRLKAGQYYEAADTYRQAAALDPSNPLPRLGLCLAQFANAESLAAAYHLKRAAEIYPPVLTTHLDIASLVDADLIQRRLNFLAMRLAEQQTAPEPMLYFIGAFMHANMGQLDQARTYALKLQATAGGDTILANYARYLLANATTAPAPGPATAPAAGEAK